MATFNDMPVDILFEIFSLIDILERQRLQTVCKRWRWIIQHMWRSMHKLKFSWSHINDCKTINGRNAGGCRINRKNISAFRELSQLFNGNLNKLEVKDHHFYDKPDPSADTFALLRRNTDLKSVRISTFNEVMMENFLACLSTTSLQHLSITGITSHNTTKLIEKILLEAQALLTYLYLDKVTMSILRIIGDMSTLKSLHIEHSMEYSLRLWSIFSSDTKLSNLETLSVCDSTIVNDKFLHALGDNCRQLRNLVLYCNDDISATGLNAIGSLKNLRYLELRGVGGFYFLSHLSHLEELYCEFHADDLNSEQLHNLRDTLCSLINLKACDFFNDEINGFLNEHGFDQRVVNSKEIGEYHRKEWDQLFDE